MLQQWVVARCASDKAACRAGSDHLAIAVWVWSGRTGPGGSVLGEKLGLKLSLLGRSPFLLGRAWQGSAHKRMRGLRAAVLGMIAAPLAGCGTLGLVDVAPPPPPVVPGEWNRPAPVLAADVERYWTLLDDPALTFFVARAIEENLELDAAAARVRLAAAGVRQARAGYLPRVDASAGVRRDFGDFSSDEFEPSLGVDARWEADLFGRVRLDVAASRAELAAAGFAAADLQRLIVGQVARTTVSARALAVQLAIARDTLVNQDENLQIAEWRLQAGLVSSLDVEQARTQRAQTAATIPALERDLEIAAHAISVLVGEPPGYALDLLLAEPEGIPVPPATVGYAVPAEVLRRRPDIRRAEALVLADTARIGLARTQLLPLVQLTGTIGTASVGFRDLFGIITGGLFAGVSQLIFDGGRAAAQIDAAEAAADASLAEWRRNVLFALEDVENAAVSLDAARARIEFFEDALTAAENAALFARSQYQAGLIDFQRLLTAENQLLSSRNSLAAARAERADAFVRLTQALGGGWDYEGLAGEPESTGEEAG